MTSPVFFTADSIKTLEGYVSCLILSNLSLATIEGYQQEALKLGIMEHDEEECCKTIVWEIRRLMSLYNRQIEDVLERVNIQPEEIVKNIQDQSLKAARKLAREKRGKGE